MAAVEAVLRWHNSTEHKRVPPPSGECELELVEEGPRDEPTDEDILAEEGWTVNCVSPFEISHDDGSTATGQAAHLITAYLRTARGADLLFETIVEKAE